MNPGVLSVAISHTPWRPERARCLAEMLRELPPGGPAPTFINDRDYRGTDWQVSKVDWALRSWRWSALESGAQWHLFMTDDLHLMPGFLNALLCMLVSAPCAPTIGLLSNHPDAWATLQAGHHWYRTNSWIVGPAYVVRHEALVEFLSYYEALPDGPYTQRGTKSWANDDSSINEWVTKTGRTTLHPLPTIIEHRVDLESTVGHGDRYSRERVSWRGRRQVVDVRDAWHWLDEDWTGPVDAMCAPEYWAGADKAPLLDFPKVPS